MNPELQQILEKLDKIEKKTGTQWAIPVVVALMTGLIGVITVYIQISYQHKTETDVARYLEEYKQTGVLIAQEKVQFYTKARSLLDDIYHSFEDYCYFAERNTPRPKKHPLTNLLAEFYKLLENAPDDFDEETKSKLKIYSEYIVNSQYQIRSGKVDGSKEAEYLQKSRNLLRDAKEALKKSREKQITPKKA